jgi:septum formation topological specificity factor MinE
MMTLLKSLSTSIEKAKEGLKLIIAQQSNQVPRKNFTDVQKELLDAELELFNAQQDGAESSDDIQKRVNQLRIEAAQKGMLPTSRPPKGRGMYSFPHGRGFRGYGGRGSPRGSPYRGGYRGRGARGGAFVLTGPTSVDRRPTKILVSGFELEEKESLLAHMTKFGEVLDHMDDEATPSMVVHYKNRREAEVAMVKAKAYGDRLLQLSWYTNVSTDQAELEHEESEHSGLDEQTELLDDYTPLDPTYLPPGLEEEQQVRTAFLQLLLL